MTTHAAKGLTENDFIMAAKVGGSMRWLPIGCSWLLRCMNTAGRKSAAQLLTRTSFPLGSRQINEIEVSDLLPKRKPKFWA